MSESSDRSVSAGRGVAADPLAALLDLPGVADGVTDTRDAVDRLLSHRVLRRRSGDVSAESALRGAWASAELEGSRSSLAQFRTGAADAIGQGALRVSAELARLSEVWPSAPRQALARMHALAAADLVPAESLGRPRDDTAVAERLELLAQVLGATSAPAVVVAAVVHGELYSLDAFSPVSGIVSRAAVRLTLISRGLDPKSLVAVEVGYRELSEAEPAALAGYGHGDEAGLVGWLQHCMEAIRLGVRETLAICEATQRG
jgi:hypothetical protein